MDYVFFVKKKLSEQFMMSDLGPLSYFLGIEVHSDGDGYYLSQHRYVHDLLARSGMTDTRTAATPMELHLLLRPTDKAPNELTIAGRICQGYTVCRSKL